MPIFFSKPKFRGENNEFQPFESDLSEAGFISALDKIKEQAPDLEFIIIQITYILDDGTTKNIETKSNLSVDSFIQSLNDLLEEDVNIRKFYNPNEVQALLRTGNLLSLGNVQAASLGIANQYSFPTIAPVGTKQVLAYQGSNQTAFIDITGFQGASGSGSQGFQGFQGGGGTGSGAQGFQGTTGLQGPQGPSGPSQGAQGSQGATGDKGGVRYNFSTTTADADPGAGTLRYNSGTISSVSFIYIDNVDVASNTQTGWFDTWDDSTNTVKGTLTLVGNSAGSTVVNQFNVNGNVTVASGYYKIPVTYLSGTLPADTTQLVLLFSRAGDRGFQGFQGFQGTAGGVGGAFAKPLPFEIEQFEKLSDKNAIVPCLGEFVELTCLEMPETRFEDIITVRSTDGILENGNIIKIDAKIDARFLEVCEPSSIQVVSLAPSLPLEVGAIVSRDLLVVRARMHPDRNFEIFSVNVKISGIRKGRLGKRFEKRTKDDMIANEQFWGSWKQKND